MTNNNLNLIIILLSSLLVIAIVILATRHNLSETPVADSSIIQLINQHAQPLSDNSSLQHLITQAGNAQLVLLGESSHGTSEYYTLRSSISKELVQDHNFQFIALEGDWHAVSLLNQYIRHQSDTDLEEIMQSFDRWPQWLWANREFKDLVVWLREYNSDKEPADQIRLYGLDLYGANDSLDQVIQSLQVLDPATTNTARTAYVCLDPFRQDWQEYIFAYWQETTDCQDSAQFVYQLIADNRQSYQTTDPQIYRQAYFNALVVKNAEAHYRASAGQGPEGWNSRAEHMKQIINYLKDDYSKGIVWAHNTHVGDARATSMLEQGQFNIGQRTRTKYNPDNVYIIGFSTYQGEVIAGRSWGQPAQTLRVPPAVNGTLEHYLNQAEPDDFILDLRNPELESLSYQQLSHRAKGVVYNPEQEYPGNYVPTYLTRRYDALIFISQTTPLNLL